MNLVRFYRVEASKFRSGSKLPLEPKLHDVVLRGRLHSRNSKLFLRFKFLFSALILSPIEEFETTSS